LFAAFGFRLVFHAARTSAAIDKRARILTGRKPLQRGDFGFNPKRPPLLPKRLAAVPPRELQTAADLARQELEKLG
jgi:hypothetical protein